MTPLVELSVCSGAHSSFVQGTNRATHVSQGAAAKKRANLQALSALPDFRQNFLGGCSSQHPRCGFPEMTAKLRTYMYILLHSNPAVARLLNHGPGRNRPLLSFLGGGGGGQRLGTAAEHQQERQRKAEAAAAARGGSQTLKLVTTCCIALWRFS